MNERDDATLHDAKLHESARRLGAQAADRLDVEATARVVLDRLRREPVARRDWRPPMWLRIAAALVVLAGGAALGRRLLLTGGAPATAHFVADDLGDLSTGELREVLSSLDETLDLGRTAVPESGLEDLDALELRSVLRSLEG